MSEKLKELLEKINQEGVQKAEANAKDIETQAKKVAEKIINDAKKQAKNIIEYANETSKSLKESSELSLKQASRDLMLSLKDEIRKMFNKIISTDVQSVMSQEDMAKILGNLIEDYVAKNGEISDIKILLKKEDLDRVKKTLISKLKDKLKEGIEFKPSSNINTGFSISFDKGRSFFDFTDEGLLEALSAYLNPELAKILK